MFVKFLIHKDLFLDPALVKHVSILIIFAMLIAIRKKNEEEISFGNDHA